MKITNTTLLLLSASALIEISCGENFIAIKNFTVGASEVRFSFVQPQNEYLVATSQDMKHWYLGKIFESSQSEVSFTTPRILTPSAREFFVVCELSTTNKVHSGNFDFSLMVTSAQSGELFEQNGGNSTMQARTQSSVGDSEIVSLTASVDLNDLTISILDSTATLVPSGLGYTFEFTNEFPSELTEASNEDVHFFSQNTEIVSGRYELCKGTISIVYTEVSRLTWNLTADESVATTISSLISSND